jgi:ribonuclease D
MPAPPDLDAVAAAARAAGRLGIDTEFVGEGRYRSLLCLAQFATDDPARPGQAHIAILDTLAGHDPAPIAAVLADPDVEIVLHAGRQDVALLRRVWRTEVVSIFDTQIAAGFAGLGAQTGYGNLLHAVLGTRLDKSESFTRWDERPLTDKQLAYASGDVEELLALASAIQERLAGSGRLEWAREECRALEGVTDQRDPDTAFMRLPRVTRLKPRDVAVAKELASWRERTASAEDKPVGSVLQDAALVEIARQRPSEQRDLERIRGVQQRTMRRHRAEILDAVRRGNGAEPIRLEASEAPRSEAADAPLVDLAAALVRARALEAGLAYELVATRGDLQAVVATARRRSAEPAVRALTGWRRELVGDELLDLLAGRRALSVDGCGRLHVTTPPLGGGA